MDDENTTYVKEEEYEKLLKYLDSPYEPNEKLQKLAQQPRKYIVGNI